MEKHRQEIVCSVCEKAVTPREEFNLDEHGNPVHTNCYAKRILQENRWISGTAA